MPSFAAEIGCDNSQVLAEATRGVVDLGEISSLGPDGGGRVLSLAVHPFLSTHLIAGTAGGGLWKTTDRGETWRSVGENLSIAAVSALAYSRSDSETIYAGTGEYALHAEAFGGRGLLRSDDGGETWNLAQTAVADGFKKILVDPNNRNILLVATADGLLWSDNSGSFWTVLYSAGVGSDALRTVTDLDRAPGDSARVYATFSCRELGCAGAAPVMRSTDSGLTWSAAATGLPSGGQTVGGILTIADDDGLDLYWAATRVLTGSTPTVIFHSLDGGDSWSELDAPGDFLGDKAEIGGVLIASSDVPDSLLAGGEIYVEAVGTFWILHDPEIDLAMPAKNPNAWVQGAGQRWIGTDQGIWTTEAVGPWDASSAGLVAAPVRVLEVDVDGRVLIGQRNRGLQVEQAAARDEESSWNDIESGDHAWALEASEHVSGLYWESSSGDPFEAGPIRRGIDHGAWSVEIDPESSTQIIEDPTTPGRIFSLGEQLRRSEDGGERWSVVEGPEETAIERFALSASGELWVASQREVWRQEQGAWVLDATLGMSIGAGFEELIIDRDGRMAAIIDDSVWLRADGIWSERLASGPPARDAVFLPGGGLIVGTEAGLLHAETLQATFDAVDGLPRSPVGDLELVDGGSRLLVGFHGRGVWAIELETRESPSLSIASEHPVDGDGILRVAAGTDVRFRIDAEATQSDAMEVRWISTSDWSVQSEKSTVGLLSSTHSLYFESPGRYLVGGHLAESTGHEIGQSIRVDVAATQDECSSAQPIDLDQLPAQRRGDSSFASLGSDDPEPPCGGLAFDRLAGMYGSVWYELTPSQSGSYLIDSCGSSFDTVLSLWRGPSCGTDLIPIACNNDSEEICSRSDASMFEVDLVAGVRYLLAVGGRTAEDLGIYRIRIDCEECTTTTSAEEPQQWVIPAVAGAPGLGGTRWRTELVLLNLGDELAEVEAQLHHEQGLSSTLSVPAGSSLVIDDLLDHFARQGSGGLTLEMPSSVIASSRTFNDAGADGTFGQLIPAQTRDSLLKPGQSVDLLGVERSVAFRSNLGLFSPSSGAVARVVVADAAGVELARQALALPAHGWLQMTDFLDTLGIDELEVARVRVDNLSPAGQPLAVYASKIDNRTGDPTLLAGVVAGSRFEPLWVAAAAHASGAASSTWRSDLDLLASAQGAQLEIRFQRLEGGTGSTIEVQLAPGESRRLGDLIASGFGFSSAIGGLSIDILTGSVQASSRTYNVRTSGTFGQRIAAVSAVDSATLGDEIVIPALSGGPIFRSNVGLLNLSPVDNEVEVEIYGPAGSLVSHQMIVLKAWGFEQLNDVLPGASRIRGAWAIVRPTTANAKVVAYGSVVDGISGDPVFVAGIRR